MDPWQINKCQDECIWTKVFIKVPEVNTYAILTKSWINDRDLSQQVVHNLQGVPYILFLTLPMPEPAHMNEKHRLAHIVNVLVEAENF